MIIIYPEIHFKIFCIDFLRIWPIVVMFMTFTVNLPFSIQFCDMAFKVLTYND